jgi:hypothetical protein
MARSYWREVRTILPAAALLVAYAPLFLALPAIAPEITRSLFGGERLFLLALYTVLSYAFPLALVGVRALERYRRRDAPRTRRTFKLLSAANWLPLCATVLAWVVLSDKGSFVP